MSEDVIDRAIEAVSDGESVDWAAFERDAPNDLDRECLRWLRLIGQIEEVHRTTGVDVDSNDTTVTISDDERSARRSNVLETWGRYELREMIGEGSFGAVYRAWDPQLESELAIKILHQRTTDERLKANLLAEGRALARIRHPNVVRVLGIESNGDRIGLCMDFVRGQTLADILQSQRRLSAEEAVLVGQDVCQALAAVHRAHFVHRDVKAKNVIREHGGRFILMDFGAGRDLKRTWSGDLIGTPLYMAPEVLDGSPASPASDVYSAGVLLFHLVTGDFPVAGRSMDELRIAHQNGERRFLTEVRTDLPAPFVRAVERALSANPKERYQTAAALLDGLRAVLRPQHESVVKQLVRVFYGVYAIVGAACVACVLGLLTSRGFTIALGLSDFVDEGFRDWLIWGAKSAFLPILIIAVALVFARSAAWLLRIVVNQSRRIGIVDTALSHVDGWIEQLRLNDAANLASLILLVGGLSTAAAFWYFYPLLLASIEPISVASSAELALLSPSHAETLHSPFRETFTLVALINVSLWWMLLRFAARRGQKVSKSMVAGGAAVTILAIAFLSIPYRVLRHSKFEVASWSGLRCYVIGQRAADYLVFCPQAPVPRSHIVPKNDPGLERLGQSENIFTQLPPSNGVAAGGKP